MPSIAFDRAAGYYDATRGFAPGVAEQIRDGILAYTGARPESRILELGVGTGRIALPFIRAGYDYLGVDLARPMLQRLRAKLLPVEAGAPARPGLLAQADVTRLPLASGGFDVALAVHVLHLVDGWQLALQEARRVLRCPGGRLLIARDDHGAGDTSPRRLVAREWSRILEELGVGHLPHGPGIGRGERERPDEMLLACLRELGAHTERVVLAEHTETQLSARAAVQRHIDRVHSSDWRLPDDVHAEACRRLLAWLDSDCAEPDRTQIATARFQALAAWW